uniref:Putative secreted protein n=1 Tax=Ixodes ricinus TaxID=34613 RepID=A0A6B0V391_IXORI
MIGPACRWLCLCHFLLRCCLSPARCRRPMVPGMRPQQLRLAPLSVSSQVPAGDITTAIYCRDCNGYNAPRIVIMPILGQGLEMSPHHQSLMKDGRGRATLSRPLRRWRNPCAAIAIGVAHLARRNCYCPLGILEMVLCHVPDTWCRYLKHVSAFSFDIRALSWDVPFQVGCSKGEKGSISFQCLCYGIMPVKITMFSRVRPLVVFFLLGKW